VLYEDDGDGYGYERGEYAEVDLHWADAARTLTVGARRGDFPTLVRTRTLILRAVGGEEIAVEYDGEQVRVEL
jgi:alpha-D-xyloside xylohydrolase